MSDGARSERSVHESRGSERPPKLHITRVAIKFRDVCISTVVREGKEAPASMHAFIRSRFEEEVMKTYGLSSGQVREMYQNMDPDGFIGSDGQFYGRRDAYHIAEDAGQLQRKGATNSLESEDIVRDERYPS
ncbi:hypothetical protein K2Y00_02625 [Patescibacteria group bacterium]|nr:hypothetical protein [Patescibacteria group bacterium]